MAGKFLLIAIIICLIFAVSARSETCFSDVETLLIDETFIKYEKCEGDLEKAKDDIIELKVLGTHASSLEIKLNKCEERSYKSQKHWIYSVLTGIILVVILI